MAHWKSENIERINQLLSNNCCTAFFVGVGNGGTTTASFDCPEQPDIIIGFNSTKKWYYVWNAYLHEKRCSATITGRVSADKPIEPFYSPLQNGNADYEKKLIIHESKIEYFCNHWLEILSPNSEDHFFDFNCVLWADRDNPNPKPWSEYVGQIEEEELFRDKIIAERYARDSHFSERIKNNYGYQCAVCRCTIVEILEAAHIRAVKDFGNDSLSNGICLCRNHHKLYDSHLLELNGDFTFNASDERLASDEYFKMIYDRYNGKMITPKSIGGNNGNTNK